MPLKKPSEFYIKNPSTSMDEVKEGLNIAAPEKIENLSEAFNVFKTNLNHIQSISDFTNKFDSFENNVQKVQLLSQNVEEIKENIDALIKQEDLDEAMTAHLFFVEESIKNVQDKVKTLNSKSVLEIKKDFASLSETVNDFIGVEVPAYKTLIVDSETRVDSRFNNFKEDLTSQVEGVHKEIQSNLAQVTKNIDSLNEKKVSSVKEEVKGIGKKVENLIEKVLPSYKKFFADTQVNVEERISHVSDTAKEIEEQYQSNINDIKEKFNEFVGEEVPKYKSLLIETKVKTEKEVKEISNEMGVRISLINKSVENLQERVDNKEIELDKNLLKKTEEIEDLLEDLTSLSSTYDTLQKDFKQREVSENKKLENYEKRINQVEETLSNEILELQENLDTSTSKYYEEMKNTVVPTIVNFENKLSTQLKDLNINFTVNEKHVQDLQKEFKDLVEKLRVDDLEERSDNLRDKIDKLEDVLEKFNDEQQQLTEGLLNIPPNVDNQDPLTPLDQTYVTHEKLAEHYRLFINRVQQQLSTIGGGGEVFLARMQDVAVGAGIQTNNWVLSWDTDVNLFTPSAGGSAGAAGTWASSSVGVSTTKNVGIGTTASADYKLYVSTGSTTDTVAYFDGSISVGGTTYSEDVKNIDSIGIITARSDIRGQSNLSITGITTLSSSAATGAVKTGMGNTALIVEGHGRITGVLTVGQSSITIDGSNNKVQVGTGITLDAGSGQIQAPDLKITGTTGTLNPPVMTTTQRDDLDPDTGSLIFNSTSGQLEVWNGTSWAGVGAVNNLTISNL
mgnify:CR=1 FL=1